MTNSKMKMNKNLSYIIIMFIALSIWGCSKKPDKATMEEMSELEQKILSFNLANYAENGLKKWELKGDSADILADIIYLTNISVDANQEPKLCLTSDEGSYDRKDQTVTLTKNVILTTADGLKLITDLVEWDGATDVISTSSPVRIERADVIATGLGAEALPEMKKVILNKDVNVMLLRDAMGGVPLELKEEDQKPGEIFKVTITCDGPLEIDYKNNIAIFNNNVKVDDKRGQIYSEKMTAYLDAVSKSITKVVAKGDVKVVRGGDSTYSQKAVYTTADQRIVLLGKPEIRIEATEEVEKIEEEIDKTSW